MELVRKRLSAAELIPPNIRYNPDTDQVQFSPDGGVTWFDTPSADPRHSDVFRYPPLETEDPRCDAAANMKKWLKDFLDQATDILCTGATALSVANAAIPLYELISGGSLTLLAIVTEVAGGLFSLGCTALLAAFDDDVYDLVQCAFYCHMGVDGQVSAVQLGAIETQITATLTTTAALVVNAILSLQGEVGLSNAGAIGGETGDCSECGCIWCYNFQAGSRLDEWVPHVWDGENIATWTGVQWQVSGAGSSKLWIEWDLTGSPITLTDASVPAFYKAGGNIVMTVNGGGTFPDDGTTIWVNGAIVGTPFPIVVSRIDISIAYAFHTDLLWLSEIQLSGSDLANPFGDDNC